MKILIVDDSELICEMLKMVCEGQGAVVQTCGSLDEVRGLEDPTWIISDLNLPGLDSEDPVAAYRSLGLNAPVILISGRKQDELDRIASRCGARAAISKDYGIPGIAQRLATLFGE